MNMDTADGPSHSNYHDAGGGSTAGHGGTSTTGHTKDSAKRQPKGTAAKAKTAQGPAAPAGSRFQCPQCPKNFSRIENLTRHQANHEDVGKFACGICQKRFTRSDLLNRHRKTHGLNAESAKPHVTQRQSASMPPRPDPGFESLGAQDGQRSLSQGGPSAASAPPEVPYQQVARQQAFYSNQTNLNQASYQNILPQNQFLTPDPPPRQQALGRPEGLTSLVDAALTSQHQFIPVENANPTLWDGFVGLGDNTSSYMGSYDADMSWTLNSFHTGSSSSYNLDHDMMNTFEGVPQNRYQHSSLQRPQEVVNQIDAADNEDEDADDWPDKASRPNTPYRRAPRIVPLQLLPRSWQPVLEEASASGLMATTIRPVHNINDALRQSLLVALNGYSYRNELSRPEISDASFPPSEALDYFIRLYIRYVQPRFPVLHLPTFDMYASPPLLLVAMMCLGSCHSSCDRGQFSRLFHEHLRLACLRMEGSDPKFLRSIDNMLTYFLLCLDETWSGSRQSYDAAGGGRGILVTACRRMRLLDCRPCGRHDTGRFQQAGPGTQAATWLAWAEMEKRKRLGLSIYMFDCQYPALFNTQPYISKAETTNCAFPCSEELWEAPTADSWKALLGPAEMPAPVYYLHAVNGVLLRKYVTPPPPVIQIDEFGKLLLVYATHTYIFEWRTSTSMVNPTGIKGISAPYDIGKGLRERRKWIRDALHSWVECYQDHRTSPAASLLHRLAYIALDVSLSDLHLIVGRSNNKNDADFAEENLKLWANSDTADSTMSHVYNMLQLCHHCIQSNIVANSSYEVAVCLFTGGIVCWAYAKLKDNAPIGECMSQVQKASKALREMGCWGMCSAFGRILDRFEARATV